MRAVSAGDRRTEDREIDDATAVVLRTAGEVTVRLGDEPALTVTGGENVLDRLVTEVDDDRLVIGSAVGRSSSARTTSTSTSPSPRWSRS